MLKGDRLPLAFDIAGLVRAAPASRSKIYEEIANGNLIARKLGSRTIILREDAEEWLRSLPTIDQQPRPPPIPSVGGKKRPYAKSGLLYLRPSQSGRAFARVLGFLWLLTATRETTLSSGKEVRRHVSA